MTVDKSDVLAILVIVFFAVYGFCNLVLGVFPRNDIQGTTAGEAIFGVLGI